MSQRVLLCTFIYLCAFNNLHQSMYTAFTSVLCIKITLLQQESLFPKKRIFRKSRPRLCRSAWVCSSSRRWNTRWRWGCPWSTCPCVGRGGSWDWCVCWSRGCRCDTWRATSHCARTCATWGRRASGTTWSTAGTCEASPENTKRKKTSEKVQNGFQSLWNFTLSIIFVPKFQYFHL